MTEPRIGEIPTLPVFLKLRGRRAVVAGSSPAAVWKAELLAAAGAEVLVFDPAPSDEIAALSAGRPDRIRIVNRSPTPADLDGAAIAVGGLEGREAEAFRDLARHARIPVNIIDVPEWCDVQFGTIVERSPLLIGISTDGAAPVLGQSLRARIEAILPERIGVWMKAAAEWRPALKDRGLSFAARRRFWELFAERALDSVDRDPGEDDRRDCLEAALSAKIGERGSVVLVGAGPGDLRHMTLEAIGALQSADVIIHDTALEAGIINLGRREAQRQAEDAAAPKPAALQRWLDEGRKIVWIGNGTPDGSASWARRRAVLKETGTTPVSIVPGLTLSAIE